jgi:hypothetical protein
LPRTPESVGKAQFVVWSYSNCPDSLKLSVLANGLDQYLDVALPESVVRCVIDLDIIRVD